MFWDHVSSCKLRNFGITYSEESFKFFRINKNIQDLPTLILLKNAKLIFNLLERAQDRDTDFLDSVWHSGEHPGLALVYHLVE